MQVCRFKLAGVRPAIMHFNVVCILSAVRRSACLARRTPNECQRSFPADHIGRNLHHRQSKQSVSALRHRALASQHA
jgi:hypothetical protein